MNPLHSTGVLSFLLLAALGSSRLQAQDPGTGVVTPPPPSGVEPPPGQAEQAGQAVPGQKPQPGHEGHGHEGEAPAGDQAKQETLIGVGMTNKGKAIPKGNWFKKIHLDFGSVVENTKEKDTGEYPFENKTGKDQLITHFTTSCKCQGVRFFINGVEVKYKRKPTVDQPLVEPIKVPKGAKGKIVMDLDLSGAASERLAELRVDTTDPNMPSFTLTSEAKILAAFSVEPEVVNLGTMSPMQKKDFVFKVRSNIVKDSSWKIIDKAPALPSGFFLDSVESKQDKKGYYYEIKGHYGPDLPQGAMGGDVIFKTSDERHNFMIRVTADVQYRVVVFPRMVPMGAFSNKVAKEAVFHVLPNKKGDRVHVTGVDIYKSSHPKDAYTVEIVPPSKEEGKTLTLKGMKEPVPANAVWTIIIKSKVGIRAKVFRVKARLVFKEKGIAEKLIHVIGFPKNY